MDIISYAMAKKYSVQRLNHFGFNLNNGLMDFRIALANRTAVPCEIHCLGDSITRGEFTSDEPNTAWASVLRKLLQSRYGDAGEGWIGTYEGTLPAGSHPRVSFGTGWAMSPGSKSGFGGGYANSSGATTAITFNFTGDAVSIIYVKGPTGGSGDIKIDGVSVGTLNCNNAVLSFDNIVHFTGLTDGAHVLTITPASTTQVWVEGIVAKRGSGGVRVHRIGWSGYKSGDWVNANTQASWGTVSPHLAVIALGINDGGNSVPVATYKANMETLIQSYQGRGASVLLLAYFTSGSAWAQSGTYAWPLYVQTMYDLAKKYNCALVDMYAAWNKSYTWAQTRGLMGPATSDYTGASGTNMTHPGDKGHRYIAGIMERHLV